MAEEVKKDAAVQIKNIGIRHRLAHPKFGGFCFEAGETKAVPPQVAHELLLGCPEDFELVKVEGMPEAEFKGPLDKAKKAKKDGEEAIAKQRAKEEKEALEADAKTARSRGEV